MSAAAASGSSPSAAPWACRRPPYYQRRKGERPARAVEDKRLLGPIGELHEANYSAYG